MTKRKIVVALGGNAILTDDPSAQAQQATLRETAKYLVDLIKQDDVVITHGNGPQVGNLLLQQAAADSEKNPAMPLDTCVAMTQGSIGYWMINALQAEFAANGVDKRIAPVLSQVIVDQDDPAFSNPTKPVGPFLSQEEAKAEEEATGAKFIEDAGRGYRKVVASPQPKDIQEKEAISALIEAGFVVVTAGGGGIPVVKAENGELKGIEAVIDKDLASQRLAELIEADMFIILTGVDNVYVNFNKPNQEKLERVTVAQMKEYIKQDQFAPGSMLPKVEAAIDFCEKVPTGKAVITSLENLPNLMKGEAGTTVVFN